jgi:hypothetical protein
MHSNLDPVLMLAEFHNRELLDDAARCRLARKANGRSFSLLGLVAAARDRLAMTPSRASVLLRDRALPPMRPVHGTQAG